MYRRNSLQDIACQQQTFFKLYDGLLLFVLGQEDESFEHGCVRDIISTQIVEPCEREKKIVFFHNLFLMRRSH